MRGVLDVHRDLLARDVAHEVVRVRGQTVTTADDLPRALDVPSASCLAVRCYVTDVGVVAALVHAGVVPHPTALLDAAGAGTMRPATPDEVNAATDCAAGLVSPVGLPVGLTLLVDRAVAEQAGDTVVYCPVGEGGVALGIRTADLLAALGARVAPLSTRPLPADEQAPWSGGARVIDLDGPRRPVRRGPRRSSR